MSLSLRCPRSAPHSKGAARCVGECFVVMVRAFRWFAVPELWACVAPRGIILPILTIGSSILLFVEDAD
jgi:hypothetical protein